MSLKNLEVVDIISIDLMGNAVLTISDDLQWDNVNEHLNLLQSKINTYLKFIEDGGLYLQYPDAEGRNILINIFFKYKPNTVANNFLFEVREILHNAGYDFKTKILDFKDDGK